MVETVALQNPKDKSVRVAVERLGIPKIVYPVVAGTRQLSRDGSNTNASDERTGFAAFTRMAGAARQD